MSKQGLPRPIPSAFARMEIAAARVVDDEEAETRISFCRRSNSEAGSCQLCARFVSLDPPGAKPHDVWVFQDTTGAVVFRACNHCIGDLKIAFKALEIF